MAESESASPVRPDPLIRGARAAIRAGRANDFLEPLREALGCWPADWRIADALASVYAGQDRAALGAATLIEAAGRCGLPAAQLRRAYALAKRADDAPLMRDACKLAVSSFPEEQWPVEALLRQAENDGDPKQILEITGSLSQSQLSNPIVAFRRFRAAHHLRDPSVLPAREQALRAFASSEQPDLWLGRLLRVERDVNGAFAALERATINRPEDDAAAIEFAGMVLARGRLGEYAQALLRAERIATPELKAEIEASRRLFTASGGSLEQAAEGITPFSSLSSPGLPVELICQADWPRDSGARAGILMVGGSLAGGGAERIVSTLFSEIRRIKGSDAVKLCLFEMEEGTNSGFYLPLTGIAAQDVLLAKGSDVTHPHIALLPRFMARRTQALYDHIVAARPAVVHATLDMANVCAGVASVLAGVPRIVLHVHNMRPSSLTNFDDFHPDFDRCYRALLGRPEISLVGVAEPSVVDYLEWSAAMPSAKTHVIHNGFDFSQFDNDSAREAAASLRRELQLESADHLIGTAIRFTELKRPDWWVEMAARCASDHPDVQFIMFGDGELLAETKALALSKGLSDRLHFPGRISNLHEVLGALDVFVLSSRTEGLPNVLIEAQAAGVPVVSFDVGGARDTFLDKVTGILVHNQEVSTLAEAVGTLLADRDRLGRMKRSTRGFVRERFAVEVMVERLLRVLDNPQTGSTPASSSASAGWYKRLNEWLKRSWKAA